MDSGVLEKISSVMSYVRTGVAKKKGKKEEPAAVGGISEVKKPVIQDEEEYIFVLCV